MENYCVEFLSRQTAKLLTFDAIIQDVQSLQEAAPTSPFASIGQD